MRVKLPDLSLKLKSWSTWRDLFLVYWIFSAVGHFLEVVWTKLMVLLEIRTVPFDPVMISIQPLAPPYGIGAVVLVLMGMPTLRWARQRLSKMKWRRLADLLTVLAAFVIAALLLAVVEAVSGFFCIAIWGYNPFWQYSGPYAFMDGTLYVPNMLLFGLLGVVMMIFVLPPLMRALGQVKTRTLDLIFWLLIVLYAADLTWSLIHLKV
jgi:uncharacterized membrane protein